MIRSAGAGVVVGVGMGEGGVVGEGVIGVAVSLGTVDALDVLVALRVAGNVAVGVPSVALEAQAESALTPLAKAKRKNCRREKDNMIRWLAAPRW